MSKCAAIEPAPTYFYAPVGLFSASELSQIGVEWLGEFITSPGGSFRYQVASGPLCRIYWGNGKPEPHSFEERVCSIQKRKVEDFAPKLCFLPES